MPIDNARIEEFLSQDELRRAVAEVLGEAGFEVGWVVDESNPPKLGSRGGGRGEMPPATWGFYTKLSSRLRQLFATSREVLVWVVPFERFLAKTVQQAQDIIEGERPRLNEDFAIIVTGDPNTQDAVAETASGMEVQYIGFSDEEVMTLWSPGSDNRDFLLELQSRLYSRDLYARRTAITTASGFYGRKSLVNELTTTLRGGETHVGMFGLRKMGKTSLLYQVIDGLRESTRAFVAHVEVERIFAVNQSPDYLLWSIGESIFDSHRMVRKAADYRMFGRYAYFADLPDRTDVWEAFYGDMRALLQSTNKTLVVAIDEVELLVRQSGPPPIAQSNAFVRLWRLLRGIDQQFPRRLSFFVTGTNPSCFEEAEIGGEENPVYGYFVRRFLPPFDRLEASDMMQSIGQKMGLHWSDAAVHQLLTLVGGHPLLLRIFGSIVHQQDAGRTTPVSVTSEMVRDLTGAFLLEAGSDFSNILAVLRENYKDEFYLLSLLASGRVGEFRELARSLPADLRHLVGYGLVEGPSASVVSSEALQSWLQRQRQAQSRAAGEGVESLAPGTVVGDYRIQNAIGAPGGFSQVYAAHALRKTGEPLIALKILKHGSVVRMNREVDILRDLEHPNVVGFLDSGQSEEGYVYLAMEYLEGPSLHDYCGRANRMGEQELRGVAIALLKALDYMHPNQSRLDSLRRETALDSDEYRELMEARHGYVHRDVKPQNIILVQERGPVLIDFNISVRASAPIETMTATPGYLPPDHRDSPSWGPDIDLYQLGLTLLQAGTGIEFDGDNLDGLRELGRSELPGLAAVLLRLTAPGRDERFASASRALAALS